MKFQRGLKPSDSLGLGIFRNIEFMRPWISYYELIDTGSSENIFWPKRYDKGMSHIIGWDAEPISIKDPNLLSIINETILRGEQCIERNKRKWKQEFFKGKCVGVTAIIYFSYYGKNGESLITKNIKEVEESLGIASKKLRHRILW